MALKTALGQVISWYICTFAAFIFVAIRLIVRWDRFGKLYLDDYFILLAFFCLVGDLAIQHHMWNLGMSNLGEATRAEFVGIFQMIIPGSTLYITSLWAIKFSLVVFYKRLAARTTLALVYNLTLAGLALTWLGLIFFAIFQCYPISRKWTQDPAEVCSATVDSANYWVTVLLNICSDVIIMALPVSMIIRMNLPKKQKFGILGVFGLGFSVIVASIIRAYFSHKNQTMLTCTVSMIETSVSIIATCLPTLRTIIYTSRSRRATHSVYPTNNRNYELSSTKHGTTSTRIVSVMGSKNRTSTLNPLPNNWPFPGERGGIKIESMNESDESLFRAKGAGRNLVSSDIADIDLRKLGVLPDIESDRVGGHGDGVESGRKKSSENMGGIIVTTAFRVHTESFLLEDGVEMDTER